MKIVIASGKGGTGKTTVATNLAAVLASEGLEVTYADCDVEEPNGHLFLMPAITGSERITVPVPEVDTARCTSCGKCGEACQFSAIVCLGEQVLTFHELCHGCHGCTLACPEDAISEVGRQIGVIERGTSDGIGIVQGILRVREAMSAPLIRAVRERLPDEPVAIIDAPPGTSCPVIEAVRGNDFLLLVTEPTPFGLNDLRLAVEMGRVLKLRFGVFINRSDIGDGEVREYCAYEGIPILGEFPNDRRIAEAYARGQLAVDALPEIRREFLELWAKLEQAVAAQST